MDSSLSLETMKAFAGNLSENRQNTATQAAIGSTILDHRQRWGALMKSPAANNAETKAYGAALDKVEQLYGGALRDTASPGRVDSKELGPIKDALNDVQSGWARASSRAVFGDSGAKTETKASDAKTTDAKTDTKAAEAKAADLKSRADDVKRDVYRDGPSYADVKAGKAEFQLGDRGDGVKQMQQKLKDAGYDIGKKGADGFLGTDTQAALKKYNDEHKTSGDSLGKKGLDQLETMPKKNGQTETRKESAKPEKQSVKTERKDRVGSETTAGVSADLKKAIEGDDYAKINTIMNSASPKEMAAIRESFGGQKKLDQAFDGLNSRSKLGLKIDGDDKDYVSALKTASKGERTRLSSAETQTYTQKLIAGDERKNWTGTNEDHLHQVLTFDKSSQQAISDALKKQDPAAYPDGLKSFVLTNIRDGEERRLLMGRIGDLK